MRTSTGRYRPNSRQASGRSQVCRDFGVKFDRQRCLDEFSSSHGSASALRRPLRLRFAKRPIASPSLIIRLAIGSETRSTNAPTGLKSQTNSASTNRPNARNTRLIGVANYPLRWVETVDYGASDEA